MAIIVRGQELKTTLELRDCVVCGDPTLGRIGNEAVCKDCAQKADQEETDRAIALSDAYGHGAKYGEVGRG